MRLRAGRLLLSLPAPVVAVTVWAAALSALLFAWSEWTLQSSTSLARGQAVLGTMQQQLWRAQQDWSTGLSARQHFLSTRQAPSLLQADRAFEAAARELSALPDAAQGLDAQAWQAARARLRTAVERAQADLTEALLSVENGHIEPARRLLAAPGDPVDVPVFLDAIGSAERTLRPALDGLAGRQQAVLRRQRVGAGVLVGTNLVMLSIVAAGLLRRSLEQARRERRLSRRAEQLRSRVQDCTAELEALATYLQTQGEKEKSRLARDLHDELGALLTVAKLDVAWLRRHGWGAASGEAAVRDPVDAETQRRLDSLSAALDQTIDVKRRVVENLRPSLLDNLGLVPALLWHVRQACERAGLTPRLLLPDEPPRMDGETALALFRVAQEAVNNAIAHAHARRLSVELYDWPDAYALVVEDDGDGLAPAASGAAAPDDRHAPADAPSPSSFPSSSPPPRRSHGLAGMRHRMRALGGELRIVSVRGQGTRIEACVPKREEPPMPCTTIDGLLAGRARKEAGSGAGSEQGVAHGVLGELGVAAQAHLVQYP